jgi:hypothetical protein
VVKYTGIAYTTEINKKYIEDKMQKSSLILFCSLQGILMTELEVKLQ